MSNDSQSNNDGRHHELEVIGENVDQIPVELSARFLEHFSEQLYSSPNKAFEELVSNAWDAGARSVHIKADADYPSAKSSLYVLDDGYSMTAEGLRELWKVAHSPKEHQTSFKGRPVIGRFGIGKLATYVLANRLTYICCGSDGKIRGVTMNYEILDKGEDSLLGNVSLPLRELSVEDVEESLSRDINARELFSLIQSGFSPLESESSPENLESEFGGDVKPITEPSNCWTLVVLSDLKPQGKKISFGHLRRILSASLPLGSSINIDLDGQRVLPSKVNKDRLKEWRLSDFKSVEFPYYDGMGEEKVGRAEAKPSKGCVYIEGIGDIYGKFVLFDEKITGGKSDEHSASNGFHVNILGRVVNEDIAFGDKDFSHSTWARFRLTFRADGLDKFLAVNREQLFQSDEIRAFRGFLRKCFNIARSHYQDVISSAWKDTGKAIVQAWGTLPLRSLKSAVEAIGDDPDDVPHFFDFDSAERGADIERWSKAVEKGAPSIIESVSFHGSSPEEGLAKYNVSRRSLVINESHPFAHSHLGTEEERKLLRNMALLDLLTDSQALQLGIDSSLLREIQSYRDNTARLIAKLDRRSGAVIAQTLMEVSSYEDYRALETLVHEALEYLGFIVTPLAAKGEPEGVAEAAPTPDDKSEIKSYTFTYDAKSSKSGKVSTSNVKVAALERHKRDYRADYALVVAPGYQDGALKAECERAGVTPINAADLGKLLVLTAKYGAISLTKLRELFSCYSPDDVSTWVETLECDLSESRELSLSTLFEAIARINVDLFDAIATSHIASVCREIEKEKGNETQINKLAVEKVVKGLQVLRPDLIQVKDQDVIISVHPSNLKEWVRSELKGIDDK